jgi:hypothetical protein
MACVHFVHALLKTIPDVLRYEITRVFTDDDSFTCISVATTFDIGDRDTRDVITDFRFKGRELLRNYIWFDNICEFSVRYIGENECEITEGPYNKAHKKQWTFAF